jgi:hypothetical protein
MRVNLTILAALPGKKNRPGGTDESSPAPKAFGAELAFFNTSVPVGTIEFRRRLAKEWADELSFDRP